MLSATSLTSQSRGQMMVRTNMGRERGKAVVLSLLMCGCFNSPTAILCPDTGSSVALEVEGNEVERCFSGSPSCSCSGRDGCACATLVPRPSSDSYDGVCVIQCQPIRRGQRSPVSVSHVQGGSREPPNEGDLLEGPSPELGDQAP